MIHSQNEVEYTDNISERLTYKNIPTDILILDDRELKIKSEVLNANAGIQIRDLEKLGDLHKTQGAYMFGGHYYIDQQGNIKGGRPEKALAANIQFLNDKLYGENGNYSYKNQVEPTEVDTFSANKIVIFVSGNTTLEPLNQGQINSIVGLTQRIMLRWSNIRNIYSMKEYLPRLNNFGNYVDMNLIRITVNKSTTNVVETIPSGTSYTFGSRRLYYDPESPLKGNDVNMLQEYLYILSNYDDQVPRSGTFDYTTEDLIKSFQRQVNLPTTGEMGKNDFTSISNEVQKRFAIDNAEKYHRVLQFNQNNLIQGDDVKRLQTQLKALHYYSGELNGVFDQVTETAVEKYQKANSLTVNGRIGPIEWQVLMNAKMVFFTRNLVYSADNPMSGDDVKFVQSVIQTVKQKFAITIYSVNSIYDLTTYNNIRKIQQMSGLPTNGIVDSDIWNLLNDMI